MGIASLRMDKRGAGTTKLGPDVLEPDFEQLVNDARSGLAFLRSREETRKLPTFIIGHSLGGVIALVLASENQNLAGVALLATPARKLDEILKEQVVTEAKQLELSKETLDRRLSDSDEFFYYLRNVADWSADNVPPRVFAMSYLRKFYLQLLEQTPTLLISKLRCPILIVQGDKDFQVSTADAHLLFAAARETNERVEIVELPDCDHLFKRVTRRESIRAYFDKRRHVSRTLIAIVGKWLRRHSDDSSS
jgi:alpha-beta hydrolase superfamily lysophospholipase